MSCGHCGSHEHETHRHSHHHHRGGENPCCIAAHNTAACESLPSQIQNFSNQFFGEVVKTSVDGKVIWSLPCNLDTGLENNPRSVDEGLACYLLRLMQDGITGRTGPPGNPGTNGANGNNAYTVTLAAFTQPSPGNPNLQITTAYNPAILSGSYIFIGGSGWYLVNAADTSGTLFVQLVQPIPSVSAGNTVTAGKLVVVTGPPGIQGQTGTGTPGPQGDPGPAGQPVSMENAFYFATVGTDFPLPATYTAVNFVNSSPEVLLVSAGKHLVTATITVYGTAGVTAPDAAICKLRNTSTATDVPGSEMNISEISQDQFTQFSINVIVTTSGVNQTVALFGRASGASIISVAALNTTITAVRIA